MNVKLKRIVPVSAPIYKIEMEVSLEQLDCLKAIGGKNHSTAVFVFGKDSTQTSIASAMLANFFDLQEER